MDGGDDGTRTLAAARFCEVWPESLEGMKIGAKRRLGLPAAEVPDCLGYAANQWPSDQDVISEIEIVAMADRAILESLQPLEERLAELRTEEIEVGEGTGVVASDTVKLDYIGVLAADGSIFDANKAVTFALEQTPDGRGGVIEGFREGLIGMRPGGIRHIFIPAAQAYGATGSGSLIPPDADLIFRVELISIESQARTQEE